MVFMDSFLHSDKLLVLFLGFSIIKFKAFFGFGHVFFHGFIHGLDLGHCFCRTVIA